MPEKRHRILIKRSVTFQMLWKLSAWAKMLKSTKFKHATFELKRLKATSAISYLIYISNRFWTSAGAFCHTLNQIFFFFQVESYNSYHTKKERERY